MDFLWRCVRCSCHFANITKATGSLTQEKKCPKCKYLNVLTLHNGEIHAHGRPAAAEVPRYYEECGPPPYP